MHVANLGIMGIFNAGIQDVVLIKNKRGVIMGNTLPKLGTSDTTDTTGVGVHKACRHFSNKIPGRIQTRQVYT